MPQRTLADRFCQHAKAGEGEAQTDYFDEDTTGLALRVFKSGAKSWMYRFTWGGKRKWMTFGSYPATSLKRARTLADEARTALRDGNDPRTALAKPETLRAVCEEWAKWEAGGLRTGADITAALDRAVYPVLGDRPLHDLKRSDIVRMLDTIEDERGPVAANRALGIIRRVLNWHSARSDDFRSPIVRGMSRIKPHERARARILTDEEIRLVWRTAEGQGAFGRMVQFIILTAARRTEASAMRWAELDGGDWLLPAARKLDLLRPLSADALAVIGDKPPEGVFVFTKDGIRPITGFAEAKRAFDKATGPMERWTLHDARRTARSLMSRAGVPSDHAERVLGHVIGGVRGVYDRHEYRDEKAEALAKLARLVDRIVSGRPTVLKLQRVAPGSEANH